MKNLRHASLDKDLICVYRKSHPFKLNDKKYVFTEKLYGKKSIFVFPVCSYITYLVHFVIVYMTRCTH